MKKLSAKRQRWLKCLHIYSASVWVGCATALTIIQFFVNPSDGNELFGIVATLDFIDLYILVPGAMGTFFTAIAYSILTNWGWFRHNWITVKWAICLFGLVSGTFWLGPWVSDMAAITQEKGLDALGDPQYLSNRQNSMVFGTLQAITVIFAVFISTLKPWKKKK